MDRPRIIRGEAQKICLLLTFECSPILLIRSTTPRAPQSCPNGPPGPKMDTPGLPNDKFIHEKWQHAIRQSRLFENTDRKTKIKKPASQHTQRHLENITKQQKLNESTTTGQRAWAKPWNIIMLGQDHKTSCRNTIMLRQIFSGNVKVLGRI